MTNLEPPTPDSDDEETAQSAADDDSVVSPPAYTAYSTPRPEGLHTPEDG